MLVLLHRHQLRPPLEVVDSHYFYQSTSTRLLFVKHKNMHMHEVSAFANDGIEHAQTHVKQKQSQQMSCHDSNISRVFSDKQGVYAGGFGTEPQWISGTIKEITGPVSYLDRLEDF